MAQETKVYKLPVNKTFMALALLLIIGLAALGVVFKKQYNTDISLVVIGFAAGLGPFLLTSRSTYKLKAEGLEVKHFLQKTKYIEYKRMYKVKETNAILPKKFLTGIKMPYALEVYYDKFDSVPVVAKDIEGFQESLKAIVAEKGLSNQVAFESSLL